VIVTQRLRLYPADHPLRLPHQFIELGIEGLQLVAPEIGLA
jgi:hypothetical protein